jgi:hypothetical protein
MKRGRLELFLLCLAVWTAASGQLFAQTEASAAFDKLRGLPAPGKGLLHGAAGGTQPEKWARNITSPETDLRSLRI